MPLPVYTRENLPAKEDWSKQVGNFSTHALPTIDRNSRRDRIFDFQEWMMSPIIKLDGNPPLTLNPRKLISEIAHTYGPAHYDDASSEHAESMRAAIVQNFDALTAFVCGMASLVEAMSHEVVNKVISDKLAQ